MAKSHQDKVAVISGAASGIGQAFAHRLAQDGAHIVIADTLPAADTVRLVKETRRDVLAWEGDVSPEHSVNVLLTEVTARFGHCDILVNCAGIFPLKPFAEMTFADWRRVQSVNLDSAFLMCAAFVPAMCAQMGPHRQHGVLHSWLGRQRLRALYREQGRSHRSYARTGQRTTSAVPMYSFSDFNKLIGFEDAWEFERRYAERD
jgi:NAD(P)-dependent dehydrogenase (short-subunit alcohol dehydrogenase family)